MYQDATHLNIVLHGSVPNLGCTLLRRSRVQSKFVSTMQFSSRAAFPLRAPQPDIESGLLPSNWQSVPSLRSGFAKTPKPKLSSTTTMKTLKGFNNIAAIVESARRRSLAKEEKENKKRDSFCKGEGSRRGSLVKSGSRRESLILGFESVAILQGKRRKSLKLVAGPTFSD